MTMTGHCPVWMYLMSSIVQILGPNSFTREVTMILAHWRLQSAPSIVIRNRTRKLWWAMSMKNLFTNKGWFCTYIHVTVSLTSRNISSQKAWNRILATWVFFQFDILQWRINYEYIYHCILLVVCVSVGMEECLLLLWSLLFMTSFWLGNVSLQFLNDDVEVLAMRANTIGDDFKFTRLSNDSDLQNFIKENTINLNKGKYIHV